MNEDRKEQWVLKINMSEEAVNEFREDANSNYGGHYWFKIAMENKMSKMVYDYQEEKMQTQIDQIRMELVEMINKKYKR